EDVVVEHRADAEGSDRAVAWAIGARHLNRDDIVDAEIDALVHEEPGIAIDWIAAMAAASGRTGRRRIARAADHGAGELVDRHTRIRNRLSAVGAHAALAVHVPAAIVRIVVPEIHPRAGRA